MMFGTITINATIITLLVHWKRSLATWITFSVTLVRLAMIILTFKLIESEAPGFEKADPKVMHDTVTFISLPTLLLFAYDFRVEVCLTMPLILVANHWVIGISYTNEGSNMDGFAEPDVYSQKMAFRSLVFISALLFAVYDNRRNQLHHFL